MLCDHGRHFRPASPSSLAVGRRVVVSGLVGKPELNGQHAVIIGWHGGKGRHPCKMVVDGTELMIKPTNLQLIHEEPQPLNGSSKLAVWAVELGDTDF